MLRVAIGKRRSRVQLELFVVADAVRGLANPFKRAVDEDLEDSGFHGGAEEVRREFHADSRGRLGIAPGVYSRVVLEWRYCDLVDTFERWIQRGRVLCREAAAVRARAQGGDSGTGSRGP